MIPIITVIIPLFNEEKYIDRLMESLQSQTHRRLQIILIDGGSTDGTAALCEKWASRWNMGPTSNMGIVELIHTPNKGVSVSRNIGLSHATGEYITFVDGDDFLAPDALERMLEVIRSSEADMAGCDFVSFRGDDPDGTDSSDTPMENKICTYTPTEFLEQRILCGDVHVWGRLYRRDLIGKLKFRGGLTIGEDMLFVTEYAFKCNRIAHTSEQLYHYFRNPHGAMDRPFTPSAMDQVRCYTEERALLESLAPDHAFGAQLRANMLTAVMLTAGRISFLDKDVRKDEEHREYVRTLRLAIKEYKSRAAMRLLDRGYRAKVRIFRAFPGLYMAVYHTHRPSVDV